VKGGRGTVKNKNISFKFDSGLIYPRAIEILQPVVYYVRVIIL